MSLSSHSSKHDSTKNFSLAFTNYPVSSNLALDHLLHHPFSFTPFAIAVFHPINTPKSPLAIIHLVANTSYRKSAVQTKSVFMQEAT